MFPEVNNDCISNAITAGYRFQTKISGKYWSAAVSGPE